ncbi:MAG TPA: metallophosphoesterase family protein [Mobilitalea sp.]|nr:metallophosphoesterase family protein [Mobilitalea sp.]
MKRDLFFNEDGKFKILQFTDIHFSDDNEEDHRTTKLMERLIGEEKPAFIMVTGDTVYGPENILHITKALEPIVKADIPWSFTFGNHDTEGGSDYAALFKVVENLPNCHTFNADASIQGYANHYLQVKNNSSETKWVLFGIDSGNYSQLPDVGGYAYVTGNQIQWYLQMIRDLEHSANDFSALIFMHIPLPEYNEVWDMEMCYGEKREAVCCPRINSGFFTALLEAGHGKAVFVGHDHINDYMGTLHGITLAYGRATGFNTYGQEGYLHGARIILLDENNTDSFETYIRLEDGSVIGKPMIHMPEKVWE